MTRLALLPDESADREPHDAAADTFDQATDAKEAVLRPVDTFLRLPYVALDQLVGGIAPGDVWFVGGFSGNGKTTLLLSVVLALLTRGRTVYYVGLETRPHTLRTQLACLRLGYDVGDVLSGASRHWPDWSVARAALIADLEVQRSLGPGYRCIIDGRPFLDAAGLMGACQDAALRSADLFVIDHVDHVGGHGNAFETSRAVVQTILQEAQRTGLRMLVATQFNNEAAKTDRLAPYLPPQPHHVYMGAHKRMIATGMLGLYRPIDPVVQPEDLAAVRAGKLEPFKILLKHTMGVVCMKHRNYGSREGQKAALGVQRGRIVAEELPA